ncbi:class II fructose-bisphosphatase [Heliorestis convoluta]|uniref:Fructose-1,6-bisphosphatase n=1 Tax=Heliorestis convoluta TaxID=356322 RepID=A0A5Q2N0L3_9FIRM|nr:class II fructose-bisphosphatase [Heliorestis convoluta]QGG47086.1 Fructose-1,6-bisphosphatase, class II [Heliorestis convoluta]
MDRELALEFARVTEAAALASARWMGRGDKNAADDAATEAMRAVFDTIRMDGRVVIGEGEMDEAPMLYIGEKLGTCESGDLDFDIAVDPVEGTSVVAKGLNGSIAVLAAARRGCLLHAPDMYMNKIAVGPAAAGKVHLDAPVEQNLRNVAEALRKDVEDLTVVILDRPRHEEIIRRCRSVGTRIQLIQDGDVAPAVATAFPDSGIDMMMGIGGAPEGVIAAAAIRCLGGDMQARLCPDSPEEEARCRKMGLEDPRKILLLDDLVSGEGVIFAATGITDGSLLKGVKITSQGALTHTVVIRGRTGTVRFINALHRLEKKPYFGRGRCDCEEE